MPRFERWFATGPHSVCPKASSRSRATSSTGVADPALDGVRAAFLLGGFGDMPGLLGRIAGAGVEHAALLTSRCVIGGRPDNAITRMRLDSEAAVRDSAVAWTFLHPSGYQSNALRRLPQLRRGDVIRAPWPDVRSR